MINNRRRARWKNKQEKGKMVSESGKMQIIMMGVWTSWPSSVCLPIFKLIVRPMHGSPLSPCMPNIASTRDWSAGAMTGDTRDVAIVVIVVVVNGFQRAKEENHVAMNSSTKLRDKTRMARMYLLSRSSRDWLFRCTDVVLALHHDDVGTMLYN